MASPQMPPAADELQFLPPRLALWHAYDPNSRVELYSTALLMGDYLIVIDPIELNNRASAELEALGPVRSVLLTNVNHQRASDSFAKKYDAQIFGGGGSIESGSGSRTLTKRPLKGLDLIDIDGAAPGEVAIHDPRPPGALIVGDAVINLDPYGFTFLPAKYCTNRKRMIRSLKQLVDLEFGVMFFAHGAPITSRARERLVSLLQENS